MVGREAGIQGFAGFPAFAGTSLDSGFHRNDRPCQDFFQRAKEPVAQMLKTPFDRLRVNGVYIEVIEFFRSKGKGIRLDYFAYDKRERG